MTIRPPPLARSSGSAARQTWKVPDRFTASVRAQSARLVWPMSPVYPPIPATLTTAVSRPSRSPAVATAAPTCSGSATSAWTAVTRSRPPAASPATARARAGPSRSRAATAAPSARQRAATARPMPEAAPVTSTPTAARVPAGAGPPSSFGMTLRVCVHKGRLSRTVRLNRDRSDHRPARWRRISAGLKGITTRGPLRSGACRVRIKRCIKGRDGHRHHARRPGNGEGGGQ